MYSNLLTKSPPKLLPNSDKEAKEKKEGTTYFRKAPATKQPSASIDSSAINGSDDEYDEKNSPLDKSSGEINMREVEGKAPKKQLPEINLENLGLSNEKVTASSQWILKYIERTGVDKIQGFFINAELPDNNVLQAISTILGKVRTIIDRNNQEPNVIIALAFAFYNLFKMDCDAAQYFSEAAFDEENIGKIQEKFNNQIARHKSNEDKNYICNLEAKFARSFKHELEILVKKGEQAKSLIEDPGSEVEVSGIEQAKFFKNHVMSILHGTTSDMESLFNKLFGISELKEAKGKIQNYINLYNIISIIPYIKMPKANLERTLKANTKDHLALKNYLINTLEMNEQYTDDFIFACISHHKQDYFVSSFGQEFQCYLYDLYNEKFKLFSQNLPLLTAKSLSDYKSSKNTNTPLAKYIEGFIATFNEFELQNM